MAARTWSFTRLCAMACLTWLGAIGLYTLADEFDVDHWTLVLLPILVALYVPTFWAGSWASTHPEIERWPRERLIVMWLLGLGALLIFGDDFHGFKLLAGAVAAPLLLITTRWYELHSGPKEKEQIVARTDAPPLPAPRTGSTPPSGVPPVSLP
jgi:hypothetical protein